MLVPETLQVLLLTAASIALVHTAVGVDHTLPFVALAQSRGWRLPKLLAITALCGGAHVGSSVLLGAVGIGIGAALESLVWIEGSRGHWASWMLVCFGLLLAVRGLLRSKSHASGAQAGDRPEHGDHGEHGIRGHRHVPVMGARWFGPWGLFLVFVFGPCEPLIPVLMAPAAAHHWGWVVAVTAVFAAVTIGTMLLLVAIGHLGLQFGAQRLGISGWARHSEVMSGVAVAMSGLAVRVLGI